MRSPVLFALLIEVAVGLLIGLALMEGRGYRAAMYGGLLTIVLIVRWMSKGLEMDEAPVEIPERHVPQGSFKRHGHVVGRTR